jgi:histidinol phosphatase-like enzyme (inositol monophosphatase family)
MPSLQDLLGVAIDAAFRGGKRTLAYFNSADLAVEIKPDRTPVTQADRESEQIVRERIGRSFPDHCILGEEQGERAGADARYRWIIDPLDGTKSFIHGVPLYGTLIGLEIDGVASVGVIYLPALDEMLYAATGLGCRCNGRPVHVSKVDRLEDATISCTSALSAIKRSDAFERLASKAKLVRGWGDCYGYYLVATGKIDVMLDPAMNLWDCAPLLPILTEAGGHFTDWTGRATIRGKDAVATNAALHEQVLAILKSEKRN